MFMCFFLLFFVVVIYLWANEWKFVKYVVPNGHMMSFIKRHFNVDRTFWRYLNVETTPCAGWICVQFVFEL